jgi:hypothetical protein
MTSELVTVRDQAVNRRGIAPRDVTRHEHRRQDLLIGQELAEPGQAFVDAAPRIKKGRAVGLHVDGEKDGRHAQALPSHYPLRLPQTSN